MDYHTIDTGRFELMILGTSSYLSQLDIDFIEQDIDANDSRQGELEVKTHEGLVTIDWRRLPDEFSPERYAARVEWNKNPQQDWYRFLADYKPNK